MVNIPLGEQVAARITGYSRFKAGIMDQVSETEIGEDVNFVDEIGGRFQLAFFPTDNLEISGFAHVVSKRHRPVPELPTTATRTDAPTTAICPRTWEDGVRKIRAGHP